jgi:hypothetical protein
VQQPGGVVTFVVVAQIIEDDTKRQKQEKHDQSQRYDEFGICIYSN